MRVRKFPSGKGICIAGDSQMPRLLFTRVRMICIPDVTNGISTVNSVVIYNSGCIHSRVSCTNSVFNSSQASSSTKLGQVNLTQSSFWTMADMPANVGTTRKMSFGINGKLNGIEGKTPFLIGVSGGTASGKVQFLSYSCIIISVK